MESNWAAEQLQTIRTLMERSAVYRRALAPIMLFAGSIGVLTMIAGLLFKLDSAMEFCALWLGAAMVSIAGAFLIARQQAFKDHEPYWSPPTRRVAVALAPPLAAGMFFGLLFAFMQDDDESLLLSFVWILLYGCALHSAGFFMPRGIRLFGWLFIASSCCLFGVAIFVNGMEPDYNPHWVMGFFFGALHVAYGVYLWLSERGKNAA